MKINEKYSRLLSAFFMSLIMSNAMTLITTLIKTGINETFVLTYTKGSLLSWGIAFPIAYLATPIVQYIVKKIIA